MHCRWGVVVLDEAEAGSGQTEPRVLAIVMKQSVAGAQQLGRYAQTVDYIEAKTNLDFFHELDDVRENALEASVPDESWELFRVLSE